MVGQLGWLGEWIPLDHQQNWRHFVTKVPLGKGPKWPQMCTILDDCVQIAERRLKPPFESHHLDLPEIIPPPYKRREGVF